MEKYVECHNCQNQYDCERTYLGGCTDGKEWEQEEKKLTDEEVIKAFEKCTNGKCKDCAYRTDKDRCKHKKLNRDILDLIRRLQYGYSSASKASEEWREKYEKERKENEKQKAEIERLTDKNTELMGDFVKGYEAALDEGWDDDVKDTAKYILCYLWNIGFEGVDRLSALENGIQELATKFDVEVE